MHQEPVIKRSTDHTIETLFDELGAVIVETQPGEAFFVPEFLNNVIEKCSVRYTDDMTRMAHYASHLYGANYDDFGARTTAIFTDWENTDGGPSLPAMIGSAICEFALDINSPLVKGAFLSSILAEYPNNLRYHGNDHYRKVLFHVLRLIAVHNEIFGHTENGLCHDHIATLLVGACVHDLGHEGGDNLRDGIYMPGQMEQFAIDLSRPYFQALGISSDQLSDLETIIFCTDITFFAGDNSPCIRMKKIYRHYFWNDNREDVSMMMMGKLRRFDGNPLLVLMAMLLHEADVATSAGLSYEQTVKETVSIMEERGFKNAGPHSVLAFLREQLGEAMFSEAAKRLYGRTMMSVIASAEADIARGRRIFYDP